jgi:hypothetical protein
VEASIGIVVLGDDAPTGFPLVDIVPLVVVTLVKTVELVVVLATVTLFRVALAKVVLAGSQSNCRRDICYRCYDGKNHHHTKQRIKSIFPTYHPSLI